MSKDTFQVDLPITLLQAGITQSEIQERLMEWLLVALFAEGRLSSGKAARLLNMSRFDFLNMLYAKGIAYINFTPEEIDDEITASRQTSDKR